MQDGVMGKYVHRNVLNLPMTCSDGCRQLVVHPWWERGWPCSSGVSVGTYRV